MEELISVIIPIYNVEGYLQKCLQSIKNQYYSNLEIILVNDGSTDHSVDICKAFKGGDSRFTIINQPNQGLSSARNTGVKHAKGEYIAFVDGDDFVGKNYIRNLYKGIEHGTDIALSFSIETKGNKPVCLPKKNVPSIIINTPSEVLMKIFNQQIGIEAWAKLYRKSLFEGIEYPLGQYFEDGEVTCKLVDKSSKIAVVNSTDYYYLQRPNSINNQNFSIKKLDILIMGRNLESFIQKKYPDLKVNLASKLFAAYTNIWMQIPKKQFPKCESIIWKEIKKKRHLLLVNFQKLTNNKVRFAVLISFIGKGIFEKIYILTQK